MKVIALLSGGLDSRLATRWMVKLGFDVLAVNFYTPFALKGIDAVKASVEKAVQELGAQGEVIDLGAEFVEVVKNPASGYGGNLNPCIDCKILMFQKAKALLAEYDAQFVVSGEVLGQRPMSQYKDAMRRIEKKSGLEGLVVRPLSGRLLDETVPEKNGWIKREQLGDINGRARGRQFQLAKELGVSDYPWPAGGCLLTEDGFCRKLSDLIKHEECTVDNIDLLKAGRNFRLPSGALVASAKNDAGNTKLIALAKKDDIFDTETGQLFAAAEPARR